MAAIISSGSATSNIDLLQKLVTWLVTRGYTSDMSQAISPVGWRAHLHKGTTYVHFAAGGDSTAYIWESQWNSHDFYSLNMYVGTGFNGANPFKSQPGGPARITDGFIVGVAAVTMGGAITSYQFIDDGSDNIMIIIERSPGVFRYLCWGQLVKYGTWTGGTYFAGSIAGYYGSTSIDTTVVVPQFQCPFTAGGTQTTAHAAFLRADIDTFTGNWLGGGGETINTNILGWTGKQCQSGIDGGANASRDVPCLNTYLKSFLHSNLSSRIITLPVIIYGKRDAGGYSALGELPGIRLCMAATRGMTIGTDVPIGPDTWRVFNGFAIKVA